MHALEIIKFLNKPEEIKKSQHLANLMNNNLSALDDLASSPGRPNKNAKVVNPKGLSLSKAYNSSDKERHGKL